MNIRQFKNTALALSLVVGGLFVLSADAPHAFASIDVSQYTQKIADVSIDPDTMASGASTEEQVQQTVLYFLHIFKVVLSALAVVYLVYIGIAMVIAMGDDKDLKKAKQQFIYTLTAFLFVNVPGQIYELFSDKSAGSLDATSRLGTHSETQTAGSNLFLNFNNWNLTVQDGVVMFLRVLIYGLAVASLIISGVRLMVSQGSDDGQKTEKKRILHAILALILMGFIESIIWFATYGNITQGQEMFARVVNLAIYFAAPVAIFFLIKGGYYLLTSAGDEERAKKGKHNVGAVLIGVIILFAIYTFLIDLKDFTV